MHAEADPGFWSRGQVQRSGLPPSGQKSIFLQIPLHHCFFFSKRARGEITRPRIAVLLTPVKCTTTFGWKVKQTNLPFISVSMSRWRWRFIFSVSRLLMKDVRFSGFLLLLKACGPVCIVTAPQRLGQQTESKFESCSRDLNSNCSCRRCAVIWAHAKLWNYRK